MRSKARTPRTGLPLSALLNGLILLAAAPAAVAGDALPSANGLLQLPNVRIETATPQQQAQAGRMGSSVQSGMRAYVNPVTGELRDQTPEEMMEAGAATNAKAASFSAPKFSYTLASGATVLPLDESFMSNAIATKDAAGKVRFQCLDGRESVSQALTGKAAKEHRHDH